MLHRHAMDPPVGPINPSSLLFLAPSCPGHQQLPIASLDPAANGVNICLIYLQCELSVSVLYSAVYRTLVFIVHTVKITTLS